MTTGSIKVWNTVLLMKNQALKRLEQKLTGQREELRQCRAEVSRKNDAVSACRDDSEQHARRLDELMQGATGFSPQQYLDHDVYRKILVERTDAAVAEVAAAEQHEIDKKNEVANTNSQIGKATTKRNLIKKRIEMLMNQKDQAEQNNQDEEASEVNLARHIQAVKAANSQRAAR